VWLGFGGINLQNFDWEPHGSWGTVKAKMEVEGRMLSVIQFGSG